MYYKTAKTRRDKAVISDKVMESLVRSLTQDKAVEAVEVKVEDVETLFNENGEPYTEPVTKQSYIKTEAIVASTAPIKPVISTRLSRTVFFFAG